MKHTIELVRATKERILDSAEELFAYQGFAATSLRQITAAADVNLAAVNYHFQSKELLLEAVLRRKIEPVNARRLNLLDGLESALPEVKPTLEEILEAFLLPVFEAQHTLGVDMRHFRALMGRMFTAPGEWAPAVMQRLLEPIIGRFMEALLRAEPKLRREDLVWGMHFATGSIAYHLTGGLLSRLTGTELVDDGDQQERIGRLVRFTAAGIRAMAPREMHA